MSVFDKKADKNELDDSKDSDELDETENSMIFEGLRRRFTVQAE